MNFIKISHLMVYNAKIITYFVFLSNFIPFNVDFWGSVFGVEAIGGVETVGIIFVVEAEVRSTLCKYVE